MVMCLEPRRNSNRCGSLWIIALLPTLSNQREGSTKYIAEPQLVAAAQSHR